MIRLIPSVVCLFLSALLFALPNMTRRGILFAVPVPADFRDSRTARRTIAEYRVLILIAALLDLGALIFSPAETLGAALVASPFIVLSASLIAFIRERRKLLPFAIQPSQVRVADVSSAPERLPGFVWLGAAPFLTLGAAAVFLHANWNRIPARFPVHWGPGGQPNRWAERNDRGVYGPLLFGAEMCLFLLVTGLASWFGARRSRMRSTMLGTLIGAACVMALLFAGIAVHPVLDIPIAALIVIPLAGLFLIVGVAIRRVAGEGQPSDPTPNECWKAGIVYYNPDDPALFVEKRAGIGYTMNFGNRWSWALLAGIAAMVGSAFLLL